MPADLIAHRDKVLLLAPTRRDGEVTADLLASRSIDCELFAHPGALAAAIDPSAGAILLTESVLSHQEMAVLVAALDAQPSWSDIPCIMLAQDRDRAPAALQALRSLRNVILLDRPVSMHSMLSAVTSALRARHRQYQVRDQLAARQAAEQALRDADKLKDEFLATLAHELRNPLAPIRTGLQILDRAASDPERARQLRTMMERQVSLLVKLIDELLDLSRIATGKVVLQHETADMRSIVETALESTRPFVDAASHRLEVDLPERPMWVEGDRMRLIQVLGNLINNAAKYTPAGGLIRVILRMEGPDVVVEVIDNGVGIPEAMLGEVFQMFTQVNRTLERAQGGLGIGLALVRKLMNLHGGSVEAASAGLGQGSTFRVRLAAAAPPADRALDTRASDQPGPEALRVLVVDDNVDAAVTLSMLLDFSGHTTRMEHTGEAGLLAFVEFQPDVVFCDIGLPGIDGNEVARRIRADESGTSATLVAVTGWGGEEDKQRTRDAGFDFHLVKPVSIHHVEDILHRRAS
jgi:signal transduction histidine kinase/CheY-like chemotaxis protein